MHVFISIYKSAKEPPAVSCGPHLVPICHWAQTLKVAGSVLMIVDDGQCSAAAAVGHIRASLKWRRMLRNAKNRCFKKNPIGSVLDDADDSLAGVEYQHAAGSLKALSGPLPPHVPTH